MWNSLNTPKATNNTGFPSESQEPSAGTYQKIATESFVQTVSGRKSGQNIKFYK